MGVSELTKCIVFLVLNTVIATCGSILLAFGAILQRDEDKGVKSFAHLSIGGFAIGVGILIFIMACYGWGAIFQRKPCMFTWYVVLVIILFIIQIVLGAIALGSVHNTKCGETEEEDLKKAVADLFADHQDEQSLKAINVVQRTFHCCGVDGPNWWQRQQKPYPVTCCKNQPEVCERPYRKGCALAYKNAIERNVNVIGGVAIGFSVVELTAAVLAWYIRISLKTHQYY